MELECLYNCRRMANVTALAKVVSLKFPKPKRDYTLHVLIDDLKRRRTSPEVIAAKSTASLCASLPPGVRPRTGLAVPASYLYPPHT